MIDVGKDAAENLRKLREQKPLVHNITNYVVMNFTANSLLAMGALPVMAHAENEVEEMASIAGALVINIGTLSDPWIRAMFLAGKAANKNDIPVILDPVGAGATSFRTNTAKQLITELDIAVIRGNASEMLSLSGEDSRTKGVDSIHTVEDAAQAAVELALELDAVIAITGEKDLVTDGDTVFRVNNGHKLMGMVTGSGCVATAAIAAFMAVNDNFLRATAFALGYFGLAGQWSAIKNTRPGSFKVGLVDSLYDIGSDDLMTGLKLEVMHEA
ncbi:MAG: hydroxyethylthiazole kinase [candidate division Zixibacteria bacterium]|nr:hydroxyethylthiazole kinase [candidate division Zixibacteria bacterium]NIR66170.1 hydroxyethylthiazole kinase [candidate division Zixibacteria bacterium]NIS17250.1 hydroxyethylthiazole kinase [candidate division Zixibacteria bacterium]NIS47793.1 hydroxyethylthiazole kinase [candidate division Zixibacteria bacterium]NIT53607.1 hydroxyethylthiazole kinase [candidate division Zixibacteria bacterium]